MQSEKTKLLLLILSIPFLAFAISLSILSTKQNLITNKIFDSLNSEFNGSFTHDRSNINFWENFPYLSIDIKGLTFYESKDHKTLPIYSIEDLYVGFSLWDIVTGDLKIKKIKFKGGELNLVQYENGDINLLLAKNTERKEDEEPLNIYLQQLSFENFKITFQDLSTKTTYKTHLNKITSSLKSDEEFTNIRFQGILNLGIEQDEQSTFFDNKKLKIDLGLKHHTTDNSLTLYPSKFWIEDSLFALEGEISDLDKLPIIDLKIEGQKPDFNMLGAFMPKNISEALNDYQNEGEIFFIGSVQGTLGEGQFPAVAIEFGCENAYFLRANKKRKVDDLRFSAFYTNGSERNLRTSEFRLQNFNAKPDKGFIQADVLVRNFQNPYIKVNINADLDLAFVGDFFALENFQGLSGQVLLKMDYDELIDLNQATNNVSKIKESVQSELTLKNLNFNLANYTHPIEKINAHAIMQDGNLTIDLLKFQIKDSDFGFSGKVTHLPALLHQEDKKVNFNLKAKSNKIDFNQLAGIEEVLTDFSLQVSFEANSKNFFNFKHLPKGEFFIDDFYGKLSSFPHIFHDFDADILISDDDIQIKNFSGKIDQSDFKIHFAVDNFGKWMEQDIQGKSIFDFKIHSNYLKISDFLTQAGFDLFPVSYRDEVLQNLDAQGQLLLNYDKGKLQSFDFDLQNLSAKANLHPLKFEQFKGNAHFENNYLEITNFGGNMGKSSFTIHLGLNTSDSLSYKKDFFKLKAKALDLDALLGFNGFSEDTNHQEAFNIFKLPFRDMSFSTDIKNLKYHTFWLEDIHGEFRIQKNHYLYLDTLGLRIADGTLGVKGYFNGSNPEKIYFHSQMQANKLDVDKLLFKFENFGQDYLINENLHGKISGTIDSKFLVYPDLTPIMDHSEAKIKLKVYQGSLVNFAPLNALSGYFGDKNLKKIQFDTLSNTLELKGGVLHIPSMNINSSLGFIELSGKQSLDLKMDYFIRIPLGLVTQVGFRSLFGNKDQKNTETDKEDAIVYRNNDKKIRFVNINMSGTPSDYKIGLAKPTSNRPST
jgi:uncharacterized protein involved in outer membrane biogenesis